MSYFVESDQLADVGSALYKATVNTNIILYSLTEGSRGERGGGGGGGGGGGVISDMKKQARDSVSLFQKCNYESHGGENSWARLVNSRLIFLITIFIITPGVRLSCRRSHDRDPRRLRGPLEARQRF